MTFKTVAARFVSWLFALQGKIAKKSTLPDALKIIAHKFVFRNTQKSIGQIHVIAVLFGA